MGFSVSKTKRYIDHSSVNIRASCKNFYPSKVSRLNPDQQLTVGVIHIDIEMKYVQFFSDLNFYYYLYFNVFIYFQRINCFTSLTN